MRVAPEPTSERTPAQSSTYAAAGVDTAAGDLAVELMKSSVRATHGPEVLGGVGGFAERCVAGYGPGSALGCGSRGRCA